MKCPLIILLGFPGAGKTTLARAFIKKHPDFKLIEVFDYMKGKYISPEGDILAENYVIKAHDQLYNDLKNITHPAIIELGTNYPRYNAKKLKKLAEKKNFSVKIIFCLLDKKICVQRHEEGMSKKERHVMQKILFLERIKRNFPKLYQIQCQNHGLPYIEFNMEKKVEDNVKKLEKIIYENNQISIQ